MTAEQPNPLAPVTPPKKPRGVTIHYRESGSSVALCGFVFKDPCPLSAAVKLSAKRCGPCEVEYLHLMWDLD